jgi:hypothetical protein
MKQIIFVLMTSVLIGASCEKYHPKDIRQVWPIMPVSITPVKDTFNVNDTLIFEIDIPETLRDSLSGQLVTCKNFNFSSFFDFHRLVNPNNNLGQQPNNGSDYVTINTGVGTIQSPPSSSFANWNLQYIGNRYKIKAKIVVKQSGVMAITLIYSSPQQSESATMGKNNAGETIYASFDKIKYFINNGQTNFHIYKQHCKPSPAYTDEQNWLENTGTFTFVVR